MVGILAAILLVSASDNIFEKGDFQVYLETGESVLHGIDIYSEGIPGQEDAVDRYSGGNVMPPFFALLSVPLALLARIDPVLTRTLWFALLVICLSGVTRIAIALAHGRRLSLFGGTKGISITTAAVLGPLLLSSRFLLDELSRLQINLVVLFACLGAYWLIVRGRPTLGGIAIGIAAAAKVFPVFLLPYFAWKRWWRAFWAALTTGIVCSALPFLVFGVERGSAYTLNWANSAAAGWPVRKGNQSVYAMVDRFYSHRSALGTDRIHDLVASNDPVVALIVYGTLTLIVLLFMRVSRNVEPHSAGVAASIEICIVLTICVLFSPLAWKCYFVFFLPANILLWRVAHAVEGDGQPGVDVIPFAARRKLKWILAGSFALMTLTVRGVVGKPAGVVFEAFSCTTMGGLLLLSALLWIRALLGRSSSSLASSP